MRSDGRERPEEEKRGPGPSGTGAHRRPKVSVCIPAYNNVTQVRQLLDSIAAQTMQDMEIILTDDSTNGEIEALVEKIRRRNNGEAVSGSEPGNVPDSESDNVPGSVPFAPCMKRLRYVRNEKPLGPIFNWNKALSLAEGEYIKIMFSDDWFTREDSLERLTELLQENPDASLAFCGTMQVSKTGAYARAAGEDYIKRLRQDYRSLFLGNEIGAPSATLYRACGAAFDEKSNWASDMFLYFEILTGNPSFAFTPEPLISIGVHEEQYTESFTQRDIRKFNDRLLLYEKYGLREQEDCRKEMLRLTVMYGQGFRTASACGASFGEYLKQRAAWFWENTVLGYWNGLLHKLGVGS
ncbi:MAG TPA: glycosyltransferase [Candidatus Eisenbergiella merdavium]|uniref:Glycosyltransferase n=1 Tax=Candidatus Eisenbergiella merdavium TaxID=2838551 RepID=A0A9D2NI60_9FIRM|nr:glycosyltransferase [Candidatus Eisenbergiella merdavium]